MSGTSLQTTGPQPGRPGRSVAGAVQHAPDMPMSVLEFHSPSAGLAAAPALPAARYTTWVVCSLVVAFTAAAGMIPIDKVVTATGRVVSVAPTEVVQPLETAIVRAIDVQEGQVVRKGQILAELDPTYATADVGSMTQQAESLQSEVDRLRAEANGQPYKPASGEAGAQVQAAIFAQRQNERAFRLQNYQQKIEGFQAAMMKDQTDASFYQQRIGIAQNVLNMRSELQRDQVGSKLNTLSAQSDLNEAARSYASSLRAEQADKSQMQAGMSERDAYDQNWRAQVSQDLTETGRKLSDAKDQLTKASLRRQLVELRADQDAVVLTVAKVSVGSVLASGDQFFTLVPLNSPLEVEANIQADESGYVHVGDTVTVKFNTFPYTQYGGAEGTVRLVSADSFSSNNPDGTAMRGGQSASTPAGGVSYYRARITMDRVTLHNTPGQFHIVPGMPVSADVKVGKRTVLSYMFGRVLPVATEGMREP
ncbi:MAG: HlyD family type I secretion periplasmic adaptor subunit [Janthinobacterium lividum]